MQITEAASSWTAKQVYVSAVVCLALGVALGYLFHGSHSHTVPGPAAALQTGNSTTLPAIPTLDQMKRMADKTAEPLLAQLQTEPRNAELLAQIGKIYESSHQFKDAAEYYSKSLAIQPGKVDIRNALASCLYYTGDADGALRQLEQSLKDDPNDANSLFNLGLIRWQAKQDGPGAVALWKQLLKTNPKLDDQAKAQVQKLIADASQSGRTKKSGNKF
jgi:cytochrome c-type biogenesis protein CcmH/NrfG